MIVENRKKDLEIGIYEKDIFESLQEAYKEKFAKHVNEDQYEVFTYEGNKPNKVPNKIEDILVNKDKKSNKDIINKHLDINKSFRRFVGKNFIIQTDNNEYLEVVEEKEKDREKQIELTKEVENIQKKTSEKITTTLEFTQRHIYKKPVENVFTRVFTIENIIQKFNNYVKSKKKIGTYKNFSIANLLEKLNEMDEKVWGILKHGEMYDMHFQENYKYYKYINNTMSTKIPNVFEIVQKVKSCEHDKEADKVVLTHIEYPNLLLFQKKILYDQFKRLVFKIDDYNSLLNEEGCLEENENVASIFLSICFLLNLGENDIAYRRINNYLNLINLKLKQIKEYLEKEKYTKTLKTLSNFKTHLKSTLDTEDYIPILTINLTQQQEHLLECYKKIIEQEIKIQVIANETDKLEKATERLHQNLCKDSEKLKNLFNSL